MRIAGFSLDGRDAILRHMEADVMRWRACQIAAVALTALPLLASPGRAKSQWTEYRNCRLIEHPFNDGDSFHVKAGNRRHYIFRLYFVDTPERDDSIAGRLEEQAAYFEIDKQDARRLALQAARFTRKFLADGFTVHSMREDARGRSDRKRYFGMVEVDGTWLSEALVREGLARIYGKPTELPDGLSARKYFANLKVAERAAQREEKGGWAMRAASSRLKLPSRR